jgi:hypothetical protein
LAKQGLDYFSFDTTFDTSVRLLIARYKNSGLGIWVRILQALYREEGYYMAWDEESAILLSDELSEDVKLLYQIVNFCVEKEIFNKKMFEKYSILTSKRIQENFYHVSKRRKDVDVRSDFIVYKPLLTLCKHDVDINGDNDDTTTTKIEEMQTEIDKLKETKLKESKDNTMHDEHADIDPSASMDSEDKKKKASTTYPELFEKFYEVYPNAKEKQRTFKNWKKVVKDYKEEDIVGTAVNYAKDMKIEGRVDPFIKTSANFLGRDSIFVDFLDGNCKPSTKGPKQGQKKNSFHNFEQQYDKLSEEEHEKLNKLNINDLLEGNEDEDIEELMRRRRSDENTN